MPAKPNIRLTGTPRRAARTVRPTAGYDAVERHAHLVKQIRLEKGCEDDQLTPALRSKVLALMRDNYRNSPTAATIIRQRLLNVIGTDGGHLTVTSPDAAFNAAAARTWKRWARHCEFSNARCINTVLDWVLTALDLTGEAVVVHDTLGPDGLPVLANTGRVRVFEGDEIVGLEAEDFARLFGDGYRQSQGLVYDDLGRHVAVILSTACRGRGKAPADKCIILRRDPSAPVTECPWVYLSAAWRPNQGRGISPLIATAAALANIECIQTSETAAAQQAAQHFGTYSFDEAKAERDSVPEGLRIDRTVAADVSGSTPAGEAAASGTAAPAAGTAGTGTDSEDDETVEIDVQELEAAGVHTQNLPEGVRFQVDHLGRPNMEVPKFLEYLGSTASASLGMGKTYVTLEPESSYTAYRGAQLMARASFRKAQKQLERDLLDWLGTRVLVGAIRSAVLPHPAGIADEEVEDCLSWSWPRQEEVDAQKEQAAVRAKLQNGTATYADLLGADWRAKLLQVADEAAFCAEHGLIHPMTTTVAGAVVTDGSDGSTTDKGDGSDNPGESSNK